MSKEPTSYGYSEAAAAWRREFPDQILDSFLLGALVVHIGRLIEDDLFAKCRSEFDIAGPEMVMLFALRRVGSPYIARPRTLVRMLLITSGAVTKQIDRLEARGLVSRSPDPESLNGQIVTLTQKGIDLTDGAVRFLADGSIANVSTSIDPQLRQSGVDFCLELSKLLEQATAEKKPAGLG